MYIFLPKIYLTSFIYYLKINFYYIYSNINIIEPDYNFLNNF